MTAKTTKQTYKLLLDADIVIESHAVGIWQKLVEQCKLILPSTIVHDEALFFQRQINGIPEDINLRSLIEAEKITELSATAEELASLRGLFDRVFIETLHPGETEALALLKAGKAPGTWFCSGDARAIQAIAMIGMPERGISMEALLRRVGLTKPLRKQFREDFFRKNLRVGQLNRITREGLADKEFI